MPPDDMDDNWKSNSDAIDDGGDDGVSDSDGDNEPLHQALDVAPAKEVAVPAASRTAPVGPQENAPAAITPSSTPVTPNPSGIPPSGFNADPGK